MTTAGTLLLALTLIGAGDRASDPRSNQIQVIGTHNSYHVAPVPAVQELLRVGGDRARGLDYTHRPLPQQFSDLGIRQIELDVFADPAGGLFAEPMVRKTLKALGRDPGPDPDPNGLLRQPGMKVLHVPDLDFRTTVPTFVDGLKQVRAWSRGRPRHVPILILVEVKDNVIPGVVTRPIPFDKAQFDALEAEIRSVFNRSEILTPDDLRGDSATLPEAIRARGWPRLDDARGKILFALDNEGTLRDRYLEGHPALRGRLMFATMEGPEHPAAAWFKINDPIRHFDRIQDLVRRGFLVRTRADADTEQARGNDPRQRDQALASGAQFVSTDYPEPRPEFSDYHVRLPGGVTARPNPILLGEGPVDLDPSAR